MAEIYLIDGSNIVYRSFYALPELKTSTGHLTNGIFGFTNTLFKLLREKKPQYMAVFFDLKGPTFRHEEFEEYKQKRKPMPEGLSAQIPVVKEILTFLGIKYFEKEGYEADDIIASFVKKLSEENHKIFIVSGDKDIFQLLSENVSVINPATGEVRDMKWFLKKYGTSPDKMPDIIGLAGDTSDSIPG
ncbi:DNA polymerase I, partial [bacterium]|nr:DNA polymerase I [bacterium]